MSSYPHFVFKGNYYSPLFKNIENELDFTPIKSLISLENWWEFMKKIRKIQNFKNYAQIMCTAME